MVYLLQESDPQLRKAKRNLKSRHQILGHN